jgi:hypothetical protein
MEEIDKIALKRLDRDLSQTKHCIDNPDSIETLNAKLVLAQADYHKAMVKFNATNPSGRKRLNPPGYVSWPKFCLETAENAIKQRDIIISGDRKAYARYQWLKDNLAYVDSKIE